MKIARAAPRRSDFGFPGREGDLLADRIKEIGRKPKSQAGNWLSVVIRIVLDWRLLSAPPILVRVLLNR